MRVINFDQERNISFVQTILVAAKLIKKDLNEETLYKFAESVEGKLNTTVDLSMRVNKDSRTRKEGKTARVKTGHKALINWIY